MPEVLQGGWAHKSGEKAAGKVGQEILSKNLGRVYLSMHSVTCLIQHCLQLLVMNERGCSG